MSAGPLAENAHYDNRKVQVMSYTPDSPMDVNHAVQVLRGAVPYPIVQDDMDRATGVVLDELQRLERRGTKCGCDECQCRR